VTPRRLSELEQGERRRAWLRTAGVLTQQKKLEEQAARAAGVHR
jgi:hypothetical protein